MHFYLCFLLLVWLVLIRTLIILQKTLALINVPLLFPVFKLNSHEGTRTHYFYQLILPFLKSSNKGNMDDIFINILLIKFNSAFISLSLMQLIKKDILKISDPIK